MAISLRWFDRGRNNQRWVCNVEKKVNIEIIFWRQWYRRWWKYLLFARYGQANLSFVKENQKGRGWEDKVKFGIKNNKK